MPESIHLEAPSLNQLQAGDTFSNAIWRISQPEYRPYKKKEDGFFIYCLVSDQSGSRPIRCFDKPALSLDELQAAEFVRCDGKVALGTYQGQITLENLRIVARPDDLSRFEMPMQGQYKAHQARFNELIRGVRNPYLRALLKELFRHDSEIWLQFSESPAATHMHHNYRGGLLEHSGEVALLCERLAGALPHIDRDLLVCAALVHDIGKIEELECDYTTGNIAYTHAGTLVGHIVLGSCIVANTIEKIEGFPTRLKHELMHLILSHHGEPEYGAAKRPMCAEALILSQCDNLSAKMAQCVEKANGDGNLDFAQTGGWHNLPYAPQKQIYIGKMRELMADEL